MNNAAKVRPPLSEADGPDTFIAFLRRKALYFDGLENYPSGSLPSRKLLPALLDPQFHAPGSLSQPSGNGLSLLCTKAILPGILELAAARKWWKTQG